MKIISDTKEENKKLVEKISDEKFETIAIKVENLSKSFRIPHEKTTTLKGAALGMFSKKNYTEFGALQDVSFEVKKGEFFGIIGRNGSGKSTLLKILAGIYIPDRGKVDIKGKLSPFLELGVGFNPELTGRENLFLGGAILGLSRNEVSEKFDKIVSFAELEEFIDMKLKNYSSGMQVRLAFSLAINAHAEILLMDEVLAVGDSNFQAKCIEEFNNYKDQGKTVVLVTHDIGTIQKYCDRAMLLRSGEIVKIGKADEVGNEYMQQNMSDEEKRVLKEEEAGAVEPKSHPKRDFGKVAKITRVEFLDRDGNKKNVFESGEELSARVYFKQFKKDKKLNFGLSLVNQEGIYVFGINTIFDKLDTSKYMEDGFFQVDYKNLNLLSNSYYVLAAIAKDSFSLPYDVLPKSQYFRVVSSSKNGGIVNLEYSWKK